MNKMTKILLGSVLVLGLASPAMAHDEWENSYGYHDGQHERLAQHHDDAHDQLDEEHAQAHDEGLSPWEHYRVHRYLAAKHAYEHQRLEQQHDRQHRRAYWGYEGDYSRGY